MKELLFCLAVVVGGLMLLLAFVFFILAPLKLWYIDGMGFRKAFLLPWQDDPPSDP
jgi:hypothetical protein